MDYRFRYFNTFNTPNIVVVPLGWRTLYFNVVPE